MLKLFSFLLLTFLVFISNSFSQSNNSGVLLYSQTPVASNHSSITSYRNQNGGWNQIADDFIATSNWIIDKIVIIGMDADYTYSGFNIYFFTDNNGTPDSLVYYAESQPYSIQYMYIFIWYINISLEIPAKLTADKYFISVQSQSPSNFLLWTQANSSFGNTAKFRSDGSGGPCSPNWVPINNGICPPPVEHTDMYFELYGEVLTSVELLSLAPSTFALEQNFPNPFNPTTKIQYALGSMQFVTLKVYDVLGNEVATLVNEYKPAGHYEIEFNASNLSGGVYYYKLNAGNFTQTKKLILIK